MVTVVGVPRKNFPRQRHVRAREDREADDVDAFLECGVGDAGGGEADALVDHLDAGVAGGDRDLLGPVAVAVEAGLADQHLQAAAEAGVGGVDLGADRGKDVCRDVSALLFSLSTSEAHLTSTSRQKSLSSLSG